METTDKKFTEFISKLQQLKKLAKQYQAEWPNYPFSGDINHSGNGFWQKKTHLLVNDIDLELDELWELIKEHTSPEDNFAGRYAIPTLLNFTVDLSGDIKAVINSREPDKVDALIQLLKKVQRRHQALDYVKADLATAKNNNWHNEDFTEVLWNGERYKFNTPQQTLAVKYLWENKRAREINIGEAIGSVANNFRLIHIFRQKKGENIPMHPAWGTMIVPDGKGVYALAEKRNPPKK